MPDVHAVHRRPGRLLREHTYPPYLAYEDVTVAPGTKPIYLYLRLSKYHRDGADAVERQRLDLQRLLHGEGLWTIMGEYIDNDSASASAVKTRRGWRALNSDIESGAVRAVAFWKLDRTNRIASQIIEWLGWCLNGGVELVSHQDSPSELNNASAGAKLATGLKALFAEIETDTMSTRQKAAKAHAAEAGFHHGGSVPFGWKIGPKAVDEHGRSGTRLVPHDIEFAALQEAVQLTLAGRSLSEIAHYWADHYGIVTAQGRHLYEGNISRYLRSPRMVGYRMRNVPEHQRGVQLNLMDYIVRDTHGEPVISQERVCDVATWHRVQRSLMDRSTARVRKAWGDNGIEWILTTILRCPSCGRSLYGADQSKRTRAGVSYQRRVYLCRTNARVAKGVCTGGVSIHADDSEAYVFAWLEEYLTTDRLSRARAELVAKRGDAPEGRLLRELDEARVERDELLAKQGSTEFTGAMVTVLLGMLSNATQRIEKLERQLESPAGGDLPTETGGELLQRWPAMSLSQKRTAIRQTIDRIEVAPGRMPAAERLTVIPKF